MNLENVILYVKDVHKNQVDKCGSPYYKHPIWVMENLPIWASDDLKAAALLHDVLEDCNKKISDLHHLNLSKYTLRFLRYITHYKNESYQYYIDRIIDSNDIELLILKYTDMKHNLLQSRLDKLDEKTRNRLIKKYSYNFERIKDKIEILCRDISSKLETLYILNKDDCNLDEKFEDYSFVDRTMLKYQYIASELNKKYSICSFCCNYYPDEIDSESNICFYEERCIINWLDVCDMLE